MAKILDFNCVRNFCQKVVVYIVSFELRLFGFSLEPYYLRGFFPLVYRRSIAWPYILLGSY